MYEPCSLHLSPDKHITSLSGAARYYQDRLEVLQGFAHRCCLKQGLLTAAVQRKRVVIEEEACPCAELSTMLS